MHGPLLGGSGYSYYFIRVGLIRQKTFSVKKPGFAEIERILDFFIRQNTFCVENTGFDGA